VIVLERTGNDLRGRCPSAIDQYNELRAFGQIASSSASRAFMATIFPDQGMRQRP